MSAIERDPDEMANTILAQLAPPPGASALRLFLGRLRNGIERDDGIIASFLRKRFQSQRRAHQHERGL